MRFVLLRLYRSASSTVGPHEAGAAFEPIRASDAPRRYGFDRTTQQRCTCAVRSMRVRTV
ncbi:hypothetical protein D7S86_15580 [Pararobbsia silviterrae]|uniref:Uncharacterized protein n=1 Tax=Pararobbsia silviterrae TaxID=1792498 RepID=A0A494XZR1_9BURK|nr:hypothetical protein D7S86_15580 [Pararobbsia silviterrae]